jgi:hypothetical protein
VSRAQRAHADVALIAASIKRTIAALEDELATIERALAAHEASDPQFGIKKGAMFNPARAAMRFDPDIRAFCERLRACGKRGIARIFLPPSHLGIFYGRLQS